MRITDELRQWIGAHYVLVGGITELIEIVDRIDEKHRHAIGYVDGRDPETMAENGWVRLHVDADGVPILVGDVMDKGKVTCIRNCGNGWEVILNSLYTYDASSLHHHKPTVEDVLREFAGMLAGAENNWGSDVDDAIAKYAEKLQLREES